VPTLKHLLKAEKLSTKGLKGDLIERLVLRHGQSPTLPLASVGSVASDKEVLKTLPQGSVFIRACKS
jgi:hypothetical protein